MKTVSLAIIVSSFSAILTGFLSQVPMGSDLVNDLIQIPVVAILVYLVLSLADKNHTTMIAREKTFTSVTNSLLDLISKNPAMLCPDRDDCRLAKAMEQARLLMLEKGKE